MTRGRHVRPWAKAVLVRRSVTAALVLGSSSLAFLPLASAAPTWPTDASSTTTVVPAAEAWYQPDPSCDLGLPTGCLGGLTPPDGVPAPTDLPGSPYPEGTLHVSVEGGAETARTYLSYALPAVEAQLVGASLDVPLDTAAGSGSVTPEASRVVVCAFDGALRPAEGSVAAPPAASCAASVVLRYAATPAPRLTADLAPLLEQLAVGHGLALLPDATAPQPTAWHVAFSAHTRTDALTAPASLRLTLRPLGEQGTAPGFVALPPQAVVGLAPGLAAEPTAALGSAVPPPALPAAGPAARTGAQPELRVVRVGYAYPAVWLLPLVFLIGVPLVARCLTRDLTPPPPEERA